MFTLGENIGDIKSISSSLLSTFTSTPAFSYTFVEKKVEEMELSINYTQENIEKVKEMFIPSLEDRQDVNFRLLCLEQLLYAKDVLENKHSYSFDEVNQQFEKAKSLIFSSHQCSLRNFLEKKLDELINKPIKQDQNKVNINTLNAASSEVELHDYLIEIANNNFINLGKELRGIVARTILSKLPFKSMKEVILELEDLINFYNSQVEAIQYTKNREEWMVIYGELFAGLCIPDLNDLVDKYLALQLPKLSYSELKSILLEINKPENSSVDILSNNTQELGIIFS